MSTVGMGVVKRGAKNTDYDAAQTLLDLQSNKNLVGNAGTCEYIEFYIIVFIYLHNLIVL